MIHQIVSHRFVMLCLSILVAVPFLIRLPDVKTVDNVDYFTLEDDQDIQFYDAFKEIFGNDEFFIIAFTKDEIFTRENLTLLQQITEDLEEIQDLREVRSLANVNDTIGEEDYFIVEKFLEQIPETKEGLDDLKKRALANPLYVKNFISEDGKTVAVVVSVYDRPDDPGYRKRVIGQCQAVLEKYRDQTGEVFMAGWTTTNFYLSQYMKKDIATFIPVTYIFITLAVFLFFRNIRLTLVAILNISICMGSTMGLFPMFGITLNNVTTIVPPIVMALALCDTVHIFSHLDKELVSQFSKKEDALAHILKKVFIPCLLTTITTAIGFLSLCLSAIPPIRDFAVIASAGMVFEFVYSFLFLPSVLLFFDPHTIFPSKSIFHNKGSNVWGLLSRFSIQHNKSIVFSAMGLLILAVNLAQNIKVETNLLDYFKKDSPVWKSSDFVETNLAGVRTVDISLRSGSTDAFKQPENIKIIEKIETYARGIQGVDSALSFSDFIKDMNQSFHNENGEFYSIPESENLVAQYLLLYNFEDIDGFVNETFDHAKISIRTSAHLTSEQARIIDGLRLFIDTLDCKNLDIKVTGQAVLHVNTIDALVSGQIQSLGLAAFVIVLILFVVLKSFKLGALSLIPNLFPLVLNFGIMGFLSIPLNTATALISAVAIGIAVDDTIHFLTEYKVQMKNGLNVPEAIERVIAGKGKAILLSSLILSIGFGTMIFSRFVPTVHFGLLSAVIMATAVIGDLVLLPSLICCFYSFAGRRGE